MPRGRGFERCSRLRDLPDGTQNPTQMDLAECREPHVAGGLGLVDRELQGGGAGVVVAGLALRSAEIRELVGLGLLEAQLSRSFRSPAEVEDGFVEPVLEPGQLAEDRFASNLKPGVLDLT